MTPEDWEKIKGAFDTAVELGPDARAAWLEALAADEPALAEEVRMLLVADGEQDSPLGEVIAAELTDLSKSGGRDPWLGRRLGQFEIVELIERGGMSAVYLGSRSDQQFEQTVAIKILDNRLVSDDALARFRAERQILASLSHPAIAALYDGGTTEEGIPYLVMEYVDGIPVDRYCDEARLHLGERLQLFKRICAAVEYAHRNLIVHRDIKPSNILVAENGQPKLLDFGIAKPLRPESLDYTIAVTRLESRAMTPEFASPEQVRGEAITTSTDIYSLGVLLYKLLSGHMPYAFAGSRPRDIELAICDTEPTRPSTIVTRTSGLADEHVAAHRGTTIRSLQKTLEGDLDNIVLMALAKDPGRRYPTLRAFMDDIERYECKKPVTARAPSPLYLLSRFATRNRAAVLTGSAFVIALAGIVVVYTWQLAEQRNVARLQAERASQVSTFMTELFEEADPRITLGDAVSVREVLDRGARRVADELGDQPELQAELLATIADSYHSFYEQAAIEELLQETAPRLAEQLGRDHPVVLRLYFRLGVSYTNQDKLDEADAILEENLAIQSALHGEQSLEAAIVRAQIAETQSRANNFDEAESNFLAALEVLRNAGDAAAPLLSNYLLQYGIMLRRSDRIDEEEPFLLEALGVQERLVGREHPDYSDVVNNLANYYYEIGQFRQAERYMTEFVDLQRRLYTEDSIPYGMAISNYGNLLSSTDRMEEAVDALDTAIGIYLAHGGPDNTRYAFGLENRANILMEMGQLDRAEADFRDVLRIIEANFGAEHFEYAWSLSNYAGLLHRMQRIEEAIEHMTTAADIFTQTVGERNSQTLYARIRLASYYNDLGNSTQALAIGVPTVRLMREELAENSRHRITGTRLLGTIYRDAGNFEDADAAYLDSIALAEQLDNPLVHIVPADTGLAESLVRQERFEEAEARLLAHHDELAAPGTPTAIRVGEINDALISLYEAWGKPERAAEYRGE